jgi:hypothetical protein
MAVVLDLPLTTYSPNDDQHIYPKVSLQRVVASHGPTTAQRIEKSNPRFSKFIEEWFTVPEDGDTRSAAQLEREKYVLLHPWTGKFRRWMIIIPSFVIQLCVGSVRDESPLSKNKRVPSPLLLPPIQLSPPSSNSSTRGPFSTAQATWYGAKLAQTPKHSRLLSLQRGSSHGYSAPTLKGYVNACGVGVAAMGLPLHNPASCRLALFDAPCTPPSCAPSPGRSLL